MRYSVHRHIRTGRLPGIAFLILALPAMLAACRPEPEATTPEARPVRTVVAEKREAGVPITLTGRIEAEDEVALGFVFRAG